MIASVVRIVGVEEKRETKGNFVSFDIPPEVSVRKVEVEVLGITVIIAVEAEVEVQIIVIASMSEVTIGMEVEVEVEAMTEAIVTTIIVLFVQ